MPSTDTGEKPVAEPFPSVEALERRHMELLEGQSDEPTIENTDLDELTKYLRSATATGASIYGFNERRGVQSILNYWSTMFFELGEEPPDYILIRFDAEARPTLEGVACPFIGLRPYSAADQEFFFGRERLTADATDRLENGSSLTLIGAPALGKTSLIFAGIIPEMQRRGDWPCVIAMVPGDAPIDNLTSCLRDAGWENLDPEKIREEPGYLANNVSNPPKNTILVIDQLEEAAILCRERSERAAFFSALLALVESDNPRFKVLTAMRTDTLDIVARIPVAERIEHAGKFIKRSMLEVNCMTHAEFMHVLRGPSEKVGLELRPDVSEAILRDSQGLPTLLPLFQIVMGQLWDAKQGNLITLKDYKNEDKSNANDLQGIEGIIDRACERTYNDRLDEQGREVASAALQRLTTVGVSTRFTTARLRMSSFEEHLLEVTSADAEKIAKVIEILREDDLLRVVAPLSGNIVQVELGHCELCYFWRQFLDSWLEPIREDLQKRRTLEIKCAEWLVRGSTDQGLLDRRALKLAEEWMECSRTRRLGYPSTLGPLVKATKARRSKLIRITVLGSLLVACIGVYFFQNIRSELEGDKKALKDDKGVLKQERTLLKQEKLVLTKEKENIEADLDDSNRDLDESVQATMVLLKYEAAKLDLLKEAVMKKQRELSTAGYGQEHLKKAAEMSAGEKFDADIVIQYIDTETAEGYLEELEQEDLDEQALAEKRTDLENLQKVAGDRASSLDGWIYVLSERTDADDQWMIGSLNIDIYGSPLSIDVRGIKKHGLERRESLQLLAYQYQRTVTNEQPSSSVGRKPFFFTLELKRHSGEDPNRSYWIGSLFHPKYPRIKVSEFALSWTPLAEPSE